VYFRAFLISEVCPQSILNFVRAALSGLYNN